MKERGTGRIGYTDRISDEASLPHIIHIVFFLQTNESVYEISKTILEALSPHAIHCNSSKKMLCLIFEQNSSPYIKVHFLTLLNGIQFQHYMTAVSSFRLNP